MCVCVSFQAYTRRHLWSNRNQIWHTHADSPRKGSGQNKKIALCDLGGTWGVLGGQKLINGGNLPIGWTDWHQIWHTYADSSGNEHGLKNNYPSRSQGAF